MQKKISISAILAVLALCMGTNPGLYAQVVSPRSSNVQFDNLMKRGTEINPIYYDEIDGSPFVNKEFVPGTLTLKNGNAYENVGFRYNMHTDQIEFKEGDEILSFSQPKDLDRVSFDNQTYIYGKYFLKKKPVEGYFQLLADGHAKLLVKRMAEIRSEKMPASDFGEISYRDYFRLTEEYYITKDDRNLIPVRKSKGSLLKALSEKQAELKKFLEESNLDLKNDVDLGEVVFYYNQLMKEE